MGQLNLNISSKSCIVVVVVSFLSCYGPVCISTYSIIITRLSRAFRILLKALVIETIAIFDDNHDLSNKAKRESFSVSC